MKIIRKAAEIVEYDEVKTRVALYSEGIEKGDIGVVVMIYGDPPKDADVEFPDKHNKGVKLVLIPLRYLELVEENQQEKEEMPSE